MAGEGDTERLVVLLEARMKDFEKNMAKASGVATKTFTGMRRDSKTATDRMEADMIRSTNSMNRALAATSSRIGGFGLSMSKGALAALAPLIGLTAAINGAKAALTEFGDIADNAKSSGLDPELFQGLAYGAQMAGVEFDAFSGALNTFAKNSGLAVEGKGRMATALKALNPELLANIQAATSQEERVRLAADAIEQTTDASKRAALATALFGDAGFKMADAFSQGSDGIDKTVASARDLGLIIERSLIARAEEMGDEFDTATKIMDLQFKQALIEIAPWLVSTAKLAGDLARGINYMSESMQALSDRSTARLEEDYAGLTERLSQANAEYAPGVVGNMGVQIDPQQQAEFQAQADAMRAELKRRAIAKLANDLSKPKLSPGDDTVVVDEGGGRNAAAASAVREAEAVSSLIDSLQYERSLIGLSAVEQAKLNALRQAGAAATDEQRTQIGQLVEQTYAEQERVEALQDTFAALGDMGMAAIDGIIGALDDGKISADEFGSILSDVLGMAGEFFMNAAFSSFGGAGGGGFNIGKLFGFASGTPNTGGQRGEPRGVVHGQEAVIPLPNGGKVPVQLAAPAASTSAPVSQTFAPVININGSGLNESQLQRAINDSLDNYRRFGFHQDFKNHESDPMATG